MPQILGFLEDAIRDCASCGGFEDVESPLIYGEWEGYYLASCVDSVSVGDCRDDDGFICANLGLSCYLSGLIPSFADIDTNQNGINDALSVGLRLGLSGATLAEPAVEP